VSDQPDPDAVARYAAAVRAAVADLGDEERAQLLDDLEAHLHEVAAEPGATLAERLGPPEAYAAELRAAYGAPPGSRRPPAPTRRHRWRRLAALAGILLVAAGGASAWWFTSQSGSGGQTGPPWSRARLQSEAAAGHVATLEIQGRTGTATERNGVRHTVNLSNTTEALAAQMVQDGVDVAYVQPEPALHSLWILSLATMVLFLGIPLVFVVVLAALVLGVLWRLYRRLGRPPGIM
jgi:hypothetical protein